MPLTPLQCYVELPTGEFSTAFVIRASSVDYAENGDGVARATILLYKDLASFQAGKQPQTVRQLEWPVTAEQAAALVDFLNPLVAMALATPQEGTP